MVYQGGLEGEMGREVSGFDILMSLNSNVYSFNGVGDETQCCRPVAKVLALLAKELASARAN
jgi:hypothetical protein